VRLRPGLAAPLVLLLATACSMTTGKPTPPPAASHPLTLYALQNRELRLVHVGGGDSPDVPKVDIGLLGADYDLDAASGRCTTALVDVRSTFRHLSAEEIGAYLAREQPYDCAGAVRSEGLGIALFDAIESDDPTALIGLPLIRLTAMLRDAGVPVLSPRT